MTRLLPILLLAACAFPAAARTPSQPRGAADDGKPVPAASEAATATDRTCLRHTGTRIRYRDGRCLSVSGRSWSREELLSTGHTDVAQALRALDPSIR